MNKKIFATFLTLSLVTLSGGVQATTDKYDEFLQHVFDYPQPGSRDWNDVECIHARKRDVWQWWWFGREATQDDALEKTKAFVHEMAYDQAFEQTGSHGLATCVAGYLSEQFDRTANRYIDPTLPPQGAYTSFVGNNLDLRIASAIVRCQGEQYAAPSAPQELAQEEVPGADYKPDNKKTNEAACTSDPDPCCICTEVCGDKERVYFPQLGSKVTQYGLYQTCCGHWACVDCTLNWFSSQNKSTCPFCRKEVDKGLIEKILSSSY